MGTKRIGTIFMVLGFLMVMAAAAWTGYNIWDMHRAEQSAAQILFQIGIHGDFLGLHGKLLGNQALNRFEDFFHRHNHIHSSGKL